MKKETILAYASSAALAAALGLGTSSTSPGASCSPSGNGCNIIFSDCAGSGLHPGQHCQCSIGFTGFKCSVSGS